eukprot:CAMPEP_0184688926 /NCGR_PEP_ID=MMETSP0312-20130426/30365_1 /TAXON_ID=31354 /ORGANISM="Compsopogon coeruleus, Strain SAG 36.94" /LENGTH=296 /DNA_ID=CAMNT_0027146205 /DNA_START=537 /DNA_END=1424 /DNA_ORIENTATION=+
MKRNVFGRDHDVRSLSSLMESTSETSGSRGSLEVYDFPRRGSDVSSSLSGSTSSTSFMWGEKQSYADHPVGLVSFPPLGPKLFEGVNQDRSFVETEHVVFPRQAYVIVNDQRLMKRGMGAVFGPDGSFIFDIWYCSNDFLSFSIGESKSKRALLCVDKDHRKSPTRGLHGSIRQIVRNIDLASNIAKGSELFQLTTTAHPTRATILHGFENMVSLSFRGSIASGMAIYTLGSTFPIAVAGVPLLGNFLPGIHRYGLEISDCTKQEAVVILSAVHALAVREAKFLNSPSIIREPEGW